MSLPVHVNQSIGAMASIHKLAECEVSTHQRGIERLTSVLAQPSSIYVTIALFCGWVGFNLAAFEFGGQPFDAPPFAYLHLVLTFLAFLIATAVLISQDRQTRLSEKRGHLDLQINLLAENKIAKVIALLEELRQDLPNVRNRSDSDARAMALPTDPQVVSLALEHSSLMDSSESANRTRTP
jgi:uncharacterized membrane protein